MKRILVFLGLIFLCFLNINAVTYDNITLNTSISNSSLTFDSIPLTTDSNTIEDDYIYLRNISYINNLLTINNIPYYNHSEINKNYDSSDFPYLNSNTSEIYYLGSNINNDILNVSISLTLTSEPTTITYISNNSNYSKNYTISDYTYISNILTLTLDGIEKGINNSLTIVLSDVTPVTPTGGGGGGGTSILIQGDTCLLKINPNLILIDNENKVIDINIINENNLPITDLTYELKYFSGNYQLFNQLSLKNEPSTINRDSEESLSIGLFSDLTIYENAKAKLLITSKNCEKLEIPISILLIDLTTIEIIKEKVLDLQNKSIINIISSLSDETLLQNNFNLDTENDSKFISFVKKIDSVLGYSIIFGIIYLILLFPTSTSRKFAELKSLNYLIIILLWVTLTIISLLIIWFLKIFFIGN